MLYAHEWLILEMTDSKMTTISSFKDEENQQMDTSKKTEIRSFAKQFSRGSHKRADQTDFETHSKPTSQSHILFIFAFALAIASFFLIATFNEPTNNGTNEILILIGLNIFALLAMLFLILRQIFFSVRGEGKTAYKSTLYRRIIALFAVISMIPSVIVAVFSLSVINQAGNKEIEIRADRLSGAVEKIAVEYLKSLDISLASEARGVAQVLGQAQSNSEENLSPEDITLILNNEIKLRGLLQASVIDKDGNRIGGAQFNDNYLYTPPQQEIINTAIDENKVQTVPATKIGDYGVLLPVGSALDAQKRRLIYVSRLLNPTIRATFDQTDRDISLFTNFDKLNETRENAAVLMYASLCSIVLLFAMWVGLTLSSRIISPLKELVDATKRIELGDLGTKVDLKNSDGELVELALRFNQMSAALEDQQKNLVQNAIALKRRGQFTEAILTAISSGIISCEGKGNIMTLNESFLAMMRLPGNRKVYVGKNIRELFPEIEMYLPHSQLLSSKSVDINKTLKGDERSFRVHFQPLLNSQSIDESFGHNGFLITLDDITDLVKAQKRSAWGDVARRIAHEIKNPLTPIQLATERLMRRYKKLIPEDDTVFEQCTKTIIRQVGDLQKMVDEFSNFARMPRAKLELKDVVSLMGEVLSLQDLGRPDNVKIETIFPDKALYIRVDEQLFSQMIINLVKNAFEAIAQSENPENDNFVLIQITESSDGQRIIDIYDTGKGWPKKDRNHLLEPYMTTREEGSGLGLAIVSRIMEEHEGGLELLDYEVDTEIKGACVRLSFPEASSIDTVLT